MKKLILFGLVISSANLNAQSLKDLLYGGKLKNDTGVVRKTDDLSAKIDTSTHKTVDSSKLIDMASLDSSVYRNPGSGSVYTGEVTNPNATKADGTPRPAPKDNEEAWRYYMDDIMPDIQTDIDNDKKIKSGTYKVFVNYDIDLDGSVRVRNIIAAPADNDLQKKVGDRLNLTAPRLKPVLASNGQPRKSLGKYNFTITKK